MRSGFPRSSIKIAACSSGGLPHFRFSFNFGWSDTRHDAAAPLDTADAAAIRVARWRKTEWIRNEVPELRIISDEMWQAAKRQQAALAERHAGIREAARGGAHLNALPPAYLLSRLPDIHPGIAEIYKRKVAALTETLKDPETRRDASSDIRSQVGKIVLHPGKKRG